MMCGEYYAGSSIDRACRLRTAKSSFAKPTFYRVIMGTVFTGIQQFLYRVHSEKFTCQVEGFYWNPAVPLPSPFMNITCQNEGSVGGPIFSVQHMHMPDWRVHTLRCVRARPLYGVLASQLGCGTLAVDSVVSEWERWHVTFLFPPTYLHPTVCFLKLQ